MTDDEAMLHALSEAQLALEHGDVPIGAVALVDGQIVSRRHNEREATSDPSAHAEMLLLRDLALERTDWRYSDVTVVVTLEPCTMCAGALVNARIERLVFGAYDPKAGACGSVYNVAQDPRLNHSIPITAGVREDMCSVVLTDFFRQRRATN